MDKAWIEFSPDTRVTKDWLDTHREAAQRLLAKYKGTYPVCLCNPGQQLALYIAQKQTFYLARMPGTGEQHASFCPFYSAPPSLSGRAVYCKDALIEQADDSVRVKLIDGLGVTASGKQGGGGSSGSSTDGGKKRRSKLSLRGLLHLLWEKAEFNRWHPRMKGRRNYYILHKYLCAAAEKIILNKQPLGDYLYVPEPFRVDQKHPIAQRARDRLYTLLIDSRGRKQRMLVVGLVKRLHRSAYGYGIHLAHAPADLVFWMNEELTARYREHYCHGGAPEEDLGDDHPLVIMMTVDRTHRGHYVVANLATMRVTAEYIPFDSNPERQVIAHLSQKQRLFSRQLRYDADAEAVFPDFLLLDVGFKPLPLYVFGISEGDQRDAIVRRCIRHYQQTHEPHWFWDLQGNARQPPSLPERVEPRKTKIPEGFQTSRT